MLAAGRQPSYEKRQQLIPDGLQSEREHVRMGMRLGRPFNGLLSLKEDHRRAVEEQTPSESEMNLIRLKELASRWRALSQSEEVSKLQCTHETMATSNAKFRSRYNIEDEAVPLLCLKGMLIVGKALESPYLGSTTS